MTRPHEEELVAQCFHEVVGSPPSSVVTVQPHASERRIYRLAHGQTTLIGVHNSSKAENDTFVSLARHFKSCGLPVPAIHAYYPDRGVYLEDDLGSTTLLDYLESRRTETREPFPREALQAYQKTIEFLPQFQINAARTLDFSQCLASSGSFAAMLKRDIESFVKDLVTRLAPSFNTTALQGDFQTLVDFLSQADASYFLYRDFQARNVMLKDGAPFFIDFQSGTRGPLQYDVASLLYQSSARIPESDRDTLLEAYWSCASSCAQCDKDTFMRFYPGFIVSRMLQVLGVYGRQGLEGKKEYFTRSIPGALTTLSGSLTDPRFPIKLRGLIECSQALLQVQA